MAKKPTPRPPTKTKAATQPTADASAAMAATAPRGRLAEKDKPVRPGALPPAKLWQDRLSTANKQYDKWSQKYECERLDKYYEGKHWAGLSEEEAKKKYVINLIFATVETQLPSLLFSQPKVKTEARPQHQSTANSDAANRATLIEQLLQTLIDDPKLHFTFETTLALRDAYSRFSLVEVGFSSDYLDNPNAGKPVLNEKEEPITKDGEAVKQPDKLLQKESPYVKRLVPEAFRVSPGRNLLESNDWAAYYEWHYLEDVKQNREYSNTDDLKANGRDSTEQDETTADPDYERHTSMVRIWKIWDFRRKVRHVLADGHKQMLQEGKPFTSFPVADLKFYEARNAYYPIPPIYNWISPQDEINESREMQRLHRRRAKRFFMRDASVKQVEFEKLEDGEDMTCIEVPKVNPSPIEPIPDAPLDGANFARDAATHEDFNQIAGVSGEARGVPDATTATQANIVNIHATIRESRARAQVADWLGRIARLMLLAVKDRSQLPMMVKESVDPFTFPSDPKTVNRAAMGWKEIKSEDLGELDVDVKIDVASLSPVAEDAQRNQWNVVLQLLTNQPLLMLLMTPNPAAPNEPSPLLRKTLSLNGIKSDQEVREIWRVGQDVMQKMAMMAMAAAAGKGGAPVGGLGGLAGMMGGGDGASIAAPPAGPATGVPVSGMAGG